MKNLYNYIQSINEGLDFVAKDYKKFSRDYEKFAESIKDEKFSESVQHALDQVAAWAKEINSKEGLPFSYPRYEQFTYALVTFDPSARDGLGSLYDKDVTDKLISLWKSATGYTIKSQY